MSSSSSLGKFVVGALVGGAVGAVIGMLLAPRSGVETREMIKEEFSNRYDDTVDRVKENLREKSDVVREKAAAFQEKMRGVADDLEAIGRKTVSQFTDKGGSPEA